MTEAFFSPCVIAPFVLAMGLIVGSFLNVCIWRLPREESVAWPASHCTQCAAPIAWYDNIPLLSYAALGGRCRKCRASISKRYPLVEALSGCAALAAYWRWSDPKLAVIGAIVFFALIVVTFVDLDHWIIPDEISIPGIPLGVAVSVLFPEWIGADGRREALILSLGGLAAGGGVLWLVGTVAEKILRKEAMGGGDVKLLAAVGAFFGPVGVWVALFVGSLTGAAAGLVFRLRSEEGKIPFGPFLALGTVIYAMAGDRLIHWYLGIVLK